PCAVRGGVPTTRVAPARGGSGWCRARRRYCRGRRPVSRGQRRRRLFWLGLRCRVFPGRTGHGRLSVGYHGRVGILLHGVESDGRRWRGGSPARLGGGRGGLGGRGPFPGSGSAGRRRGRARKEC
ncbi:unnamed protein product, partial [Scytosiphon promiscuus]